MSERRRTGGDLMCDALLEEGARVLFGHPGGAILPFYDALHRTPDLRHVLVRHEQAAAHAADGYARATGRPGVCVATSGPGATNLVTGLATALMDSVPLVAVTGQVPTPVLGSDAFQETDVLGVTMPVTKHGVLVRSVEELPDALHEAFEAARSGRPGPVVVDVPKDVQAALTADLPAPNRVGNGAGPGRAAGATDAIDRAAVLLNEARRPLLMAGRGVAISGTSPLVHDLAERHGIPVVTTLLGLDTFPGDHPLCIGMPGMHGTARANRAIQEADVIVGLGLRFDDRVTGPVGTFAPQARIALFEIDPAAVGRTVRADVPVIGDLRDTLPRFVERVRLRTPDEWWDRLREWPREPGPGSASASAHEGDVPDPGLGPLRGRTAARALARAIGRSGAQVATDVGQHQMWIAQELRDAVPGTHLTSGGLGTMGYALPAAIGAAIARPDRPTWAVAGDGGFQMTLQELATLVQERLPVRVVVMDNGYLGMVRQWQELYYGGRYAASRLSGPDLPALARAYGIPALAVDRAEELPEALSRAVSTEGPVFLHLRLAPAENVYPMVPPGASIHELVEEPAPLAPAPGGSR